MFDLRVLGIVIATLTACSTTGAPKRDPVQTAEASVPARPPREVVFAGMCDASGAVALSARVLLAADDEDNVLRAYDADRGGQPLSSADVSEALGLPLKGKKNPRHPEIDLEAATVLDGRAYWLSSHARNAKGRVKAERFVLFATTAPPADAAGDVDVLGSYEALLDDLIADERYARFDLAAAAELAPKEPGGLNIEGLTASVEGDLLIGFRNPIPEGGALIARLLNVRALVTGEETRARFGDPIHVDLRGQGVRSLSWWRGRYLILAGDPGEGGVSRLYTWDGRGQPALVDVDLAAYNPEGFFSPEDRDDVLLLSDDGSRLVDGEPCKELEDAAQKQFRAAWVTVAP
jgi:hypothetical protein